jgi:hypothetical protein
MESIKAAIDAAFNGASAVPFSLIDVHRAWGAIDYQYALIGGC